MCGAPRNGKSGHLYGTRLYNKPQQEKISHRNLNYALECAICSWCRGCQCAYVEVTVLVCVRRLESGEVFTEVVVEPENSVAFLKHRIWESATLPRCGQALYNGDTEVEDEHI